MEYFTNRAIPMASFPYNGSDVGSIQIDQRDAWHKSDDDYVLDAGCWDKHVAYLKFLYNYLPSAPAAPIMMGRLCSALRQGPTNDGIIDAAIALECLIGAQNEIKFQFSLHNAILGHETLGERERIFGILQHLYDIRSAIVHGTESKNNMSSKRKKIADNWGEIMNTARKNFTYYVMYCKQKNVSNWSSHLRELTFGAERENLELADVEN